MASSHLPPAFGANLPPILGVHLPPIPPPGSHLFLRSTSHVPRIFLGSTSHLPVPPPPPPPPPYNILSPETFQSCGASIFVAPPSDQNCTVSLLIMFTYVDNLRARVRMCACMYVHTYVCICVIHFICALINICYYLLIVGTISSSYSIISHAMICGNEQSRAPTFDTANSS